VAFGHGAGDDTAGCDAFVVGVGVEGDERAGHRRIFAEIVLDAQVA